MTLYRSFGEGRDGKEDDEDGREEADEQNEPVACNGHPAKPNRIRKELGAGQRRFKPASLTVEELFSEPRKGCQEKSRTFNR